MKVAICVPTFRRPQGLARVLEHLARLRFAKSPAPEIEVIVVDNDPDASARESCERLAAELPWQLRYAHEPQRGISFARNTLVRCALEDGADFVAFVDDDEMPEPHWLDELLHVEREYDADVVSGPVEPRFESAVPEWVVRGRFFDSGRYPTGHALEESGSGNVLVRARVFREVRPHFDERLALTGGEDVEFFWRVKRAGYRMVWADEAMVYEMIPESRTRAAWVLRRAFRMGTSMGAHGDGYGGTAGSRVVPAAKAVLRMAQQTVLLPLVALGGRHALVRSLHTISFRAGLLAGMAGVRYEEYRVTHGH